MAADVAEFLRKKFLIAFDEATENELSLHPLLSRFETIKLIVEEIGDYMSPSSNTLLVHPPLYLLNNVLAQCRIFEYQYKEPDKSSVRFNFLTRFYFNQWMKYRLNAVKKDLDAFVITCKQDLTTQVPKLAPQSYPSTSTSTSVDDSEIVGFDKQAEDIEDLLLGSRSDTLTAIGIVGMGGVGKSTLLRKVISSTRIRHEFFPRIQVCLSAISSNEVDISGRILRYALMELNCNDLNENLGSIELLEILKSQLLDKRYLIVLDDVRHKNKWYDNLDSARPDQGDIFEEHLLHGLPKGSGGAVIVTSRLEDVARSIVGEKNLFRLKPCLSPRDCLKILEKHINRNHMHTDAYNIFSKIKYEVVDQCHGLPLAAEMMSRLISELNPISDAWRVVEKRFDQLTANTNGTLHLSLLCECIDMKWEDFSEELFNTLAHRQDIHGGYITKNHLKKLWEQISPISPISQISYTGFDLALYGYLKRYNIDGNGRVTEDEVKEIISKSASAIKLTNVQNKAEEYAALVMEELDPDNLGYIMVNDLEALLMQPSVHSTRGNDKSLSRMLSQKLIPTYETNPLSIWYQSTKYFVLDNWQRVWVIALWIGIMSALFTYKYVQYRNRAAYEVMGVCVCVAKGAAETLKLNMALILLPVCRNTITWLQNKTKIGYVVPFDDSPNSHKVIAIGIAMGVGIHAIAHLTCSFPRILRASSNDYGTIKRFFGEVQPTSYWHLVTSVEGVTGIIMILLMVIASTLAAPCFRRGRLNLPKPFNIFWYSHHLFAIVYVLLLVHGIYTYLIPEWYLKTTWMYLAVPLTLYGSERLMRALRSSIKDVTILKVAVYSRNVLALHMSKPQGFRYKGGQYMFVNCAAISPFEWHPFSIASSPGDDYLCVHIQTLGLGDWTCQLRTLFSELPLSSNRGLRANSLGENIPDFPRLLIDGPYGAPRRDYKKYEAVLLVGLGIRATPMINIVKDIVNNAKTMDEEENALESGDFNSKPTPKRKKYGFKTRKAYFYSLTSEAGLLDWFKSVMNEVAELDHKGLVEMHNYSTNVYDEGDARASLITMLQAIQNAKNGIDILAGTRLNTHYGKPKWRNEYKRIALYHTNSRVGVFYCGTSAALAKELEQLALKFSDETTTKFDFHKLNL